MVRSGHWGGFPEPGPLAAEFAGRFAAYQGSRHGVVMVNGTVTMEVALKALVIGWGDEVIVPALTFAATPYAAMAAGVLPVFCDVLPDTLTIDPDQVEAAVTSRTRAIMPVHLGHQMADMDRLTEIARRHGLVLVEDCAHAHGQRWRDRGAGSFGAFGSFSHQSTKLLTAGEGGSLITNDEGLARRAHSLMSTAAGPRTRRRRSSPSAPTTGWASCTRPCSCVPWSGSPASRRSGPRRAGTSSSWPARCRGSGCSRPIPASPAGASTATSC